MVATTVDLPPELQRALATAARESGRAEAEIVREALEAFLHSQPQTRPRPQSVGIVDDPELNGVDTEDWLRANWRSE
jgi:hypothetical protein